MTKERVEGSISKAIIPLQLVDRVKEEMLSPGADMYSFLPVSAYDTAWVAMIPSASGLPMFPQCLQWILRNQRDEGFWGDSQHNIDSLTATLACLLALRSWNTGHANVQKGLRFLSSNMARLVAQHGGRAIPRWFAIVFPGMIELAQAKGLELPHTWTRTMLADILKTRNTILQEMNHKSSADRQPSVDFHPPMMSFLEALPPIYRPNPEEILRSQMEDGSLFHSPSATACACMITGEASFAGYLQGMLRRCGNIVPTMFPVDEHMIRLCMVDHACRLGLAEYFEQEIRAIMDQTYSDWVIEETQAYQMWNLPLQTLKDSLAFRLLRTHGYDVSPRKLCRFMENKEMLVHIEENSSEFMAAMCSVYMAAHLMFPCEVQLHNAKLFSQNILHKSLPGDQDLASGDPATSIFMTDLQKEVNSFKQLPTCFEVGTGSPPFGDLCLGAQIQHELRLPWLARMDHLEHRMYTENSISEGYSLSLGKTSSCRLLVPKSAGQLAVEVFTNRQMLYGSELEELKRWSQDTGLSATGFGREKTTYCYFLTAAAINLPLRTEIRKMAAKCTILVTVIDDFFDEKASLNELERLTEAVKRWEGTALSGPSKVIFDALDDLVRDITEQVFSRHGHHVKKLLQDMWQETFDSWLKESSWSQRKHAPSINEYLQVAKISIAIQVITLPACCLVIPQFPNDSNSRYSKITSLTMIAARLLNDIQSYQKEIGAGKFNMVALCMKENQGASAVDSIEHIRGIIEMAEKEFAEIYWRADTYAGAPKEWKDLHLASLKSFRMLFNTTNAFDSSTALLESIYNAFYNPLVVDMDQNASRSKQMLRDSRWSCDLIRDKNPDDGSLAARRSKIEAKQDHIQLSKRSVKTVRSITKLASMSRQSYENKWSVTRTNIGPSSIAAKFVIPSISTTLAKTVYLL